MVVGDGGLEEGRGALLFLVRHDLSEGEAGVVVDADMDELPADPAGAALAFAVGGDAVAGAAELAGTVRISVCEAFSNPLSHGSEPSIAALKRLHQRENDLWF